MAMFDSLLGKVRERFELDENASASLLSALLALITDSSRNGFGGFLDSFHRVGLKIMAESWVSRGLNTPLSNQQLEDALGNDVLSNIANQAGVPVQKAHSALAFMIPQVVDLLTPEGIVPQTRDVLSLTGSYISGSAANRTAETPKSADPTDDLTISTTTDSNGSSILRVLLPLLLLGFLIGIGFYTCRPNRQSQLAQPRTITAPDNTGNTTNHNNHSAPDSH